MPSQVTLITQFAVLVENLNVLATQLPLFYRAVGTSFSGTLYKNATAGINIFLVQLRTLAKILGAIGAKPSISTTFVSRSQWSDNFLQVVSQAGQLASALGAKPGDINKATADIMKWYTANIAPWIGTVKK